MEIQYSNFSVLSLVAERPRFTAKSPYTLFCTISPNPDKKVNIIRNGKDQQMLYGRLPQKIQYSHCIRILKDSYLPFLNDPDLVGTAELNKHGNVHLHFFLIDKNVPNDVLLKVFQRDVSLCPLSIANLHKPGSRDYMNNIVHLTEPLPTQILYLDKDHSIETRNIFPNFYVTNNIAEPQVL